MSSRRPDIVVALAGNPNSGKTTIFNALTGSKQHTGNWPGVTVEKKEGLFQFKGKEIQVVDLPGTYSLSSYTIDERIARDYLIHEKPDIVVIISDASNLERHLLLFLQIKELGLPVIVVLNMMDVAESRGMKIRVHCLETALKVPVIPTVGNKGIGIDSLKEKIVEGVGEQRQRLPYYLGEAFLNILKSIMELLQEENIDYPPLFFGMKLLEEDPEFLQKINNFKSREKINCLLEKARSLARTDLGTCITERRFGYIHGIVKECVRNIASLHDRIYLSDRIDRILTNRFLGIPLFLLFMFLTFQIVFKFGAPLSDLISTGFDMLGERLSIFLQRVEVSPIVISFLKDGLIGGVGSIIAFLPNIFLLFFIIAFFEDTGYMARASFVMDEVMHKMGLHGKSFIPMVMGFGCNVPAILATRTLDTHKDRILTILVNPLISCSARLPIYILFAGIFFPEYQGLVIFSLYTLGILLAFIMGNIFKRLFFKGEETHLIMELPPYHMPVIKNILRISWHRSFLFLKKAGTVIFASVVVVWILSSLPPGVEYGSADSFLGRIGQFIAPIFKPAGFGFYQAAVALLAGVMAKEQVVSTLGALFGINLKTALSTVFNPVSAYAFMVMSLIYIPCVATIAAIKQEAGWKWALFTTTYTLVLGWLMAVIIYQVGRIIFL